MVESFQRHQGGSRVRAFTLVELLVVVSIVTILLAILLPSLSKARKLAHRTVCGARSHQLGLGMQIYALEYNTYPAHQIRMNEFDPTLPDDFRLRWFDALAAVLTRGEMMRRPGQPIDEWENFKRGNTFFAMQSCPSVADWDVGRNNSFGYNYKYVGSFRDNSAAGNPYAPRERFPVRSLRAPGRTIAFADSDGTGWTLPWGREKPAVGADHNPLRFGNHGYVLDPTYIPVWSNQTYSGSALEPYAWTNWRTYLSDRHLGTANAAFVDGHVEVILPSKAYADNALWNGLGQDPGLKPDGTQDTSHHLYPFDPHVDYKLNPASGQQWRDYRR